MFTPGTIVEIVGHPEWEGSIYLGQRGWVVQAPAEFKATAEQATWVRLFKYSGGQEGPLMFQTDTLKPA